MSRMMDLRTEHRLRLIGRTERMWHKVDYNNFFVRDTTIAALGAATQFDSVALRSGCRRKKSLQPPVPHSSISLMPVGRVVFICSRTASISASE